MKESYTSANRMSIMIDYSRDEFLTDFAKDILIDRYLVAGESSPQEAFARAACAFADNSEHAQRLYPFWYIALCSFSKVC